MIHSLNLYSLFNFKSCESAVLHIILLEVARCCHLFVKCPVGQEYLDSWTTLV